MSSFSRPKNVACLRCHRKKIKCKPSQTGACSNCALVNEHCVFPVRDRPVTVSEAYLLHLQHQAAIGSITRAAESDFTATQAQSTLPSCGPSAEPDNAGDANTLIETQESWVARLQQVGTSHWNLEQHQRSSNSHCYEYTPLSSLGNYSAHNELPPYSYALALVQDFEHFVGHDYHWYLKTDLRSDLENAYRARGSSAASATASGTNEMQLCKLFVIWALGASYCKYASVASAHDTRPPGTDFFDQALALLQIPTEEASTVHVEALNLIAFYCFSLNRRRMAYTYAGIARRTARLLLLHKAPTNNETRLETQHCGRIYWTTCILDWMTSSAIGLPAEPAPDRAQVALPSDLGLSADELRQFGKADILNMHIELHLTRIASSSLRLSLQDRGLFRAAIQPHLDRLRRWHENIPPSCAFYFDTEASSTVLQRTGTRSLASIYLRYHQIFLLLTRPVFLAIYDHVKHGTSDDNAIVDDLVTVGQECLVAARRNLCTIDCLARARKIARYGFWDSLHIFSALKIVVMAALVDQIRPFNPSSRREDDIALITSCKRVLQEMAESGNLAARGHIIMLGQVEAAVEEAVQGSLSILNAELLLSTVEDDILDVARLI